MSYTYTHPRPMITVDIFLLRLNHDHFEVLLIQRKNDPFKDKWALPGGYVEIDEPLKAAARRELLEETGLKNIPLYKLDVFGDPGRDPRGRTITVVYFGAVPELKKPVKAGDDAVQAQWFSLNHLPDLAFDHNRILRACYEKFKGNLLLRSWLFLFLDEEFSVKEMHSRLKLPENKIEAILLNFPFLKQEKKYVLKKEISNEDLLKLSDADIAAIWRNILIKRGTKFR